MRIIESGGWVGVGGWCKIICVSSLIEAVLRLDSGFDNGSIYIKRFVSQSVSQSVHLSVTFCLSPGDKQLVCPSGDNHFFHTG